ncbi:MAG: HAMP domain-containing histidine kinase [Lachnospiraceae bacterium]|nr:HAMP domain-containing histidine kinase [Lachnospiraceae bacterium]
MKKWIYKRQIKAILILLQAAAAGGIAFCMVSISFWVGDSNSLNVLSQSYEESDLFFRQVDTILANKIRGQDNIRLLETDGELDRSKQIDIQSYNETGNVIQDLNTTYLLGDLLDFYENGGWQALHDAIEAATDGDSTRDAGEWLDEQSGTLETILPVTGISLAECSRWYSDAAAYVEEMYTKLDEVCADLYERYMEYTTEQDESWSADAPSNLLYCIEDTSSGLLYTNTGTSTYDEAVRAAEAEENYTSLYEGERSYNIMVTNPDRVASSAASEWFLDERFVGSNEKVYLAVNTSYPVGDELQSGADYYAQREGIIRNSIIGTVTCLIVLLFCFVCSLMGAGRSWVRTLPGSGEDEAGNQQTRSEQAALLSIDAVPIELALGIYLIIAILYSLLASGWGQITVLFPGSENLQAAVFAASAWLIFLSACLGFVRRLLAKTLWTNSVTYTLILTWRKVNSSRAASGQLLLFYIGFFVLNALFMLFLGRVGLVLVVLLDMAVLLYLMRDMAGKQNVYEGIYQLSQGDLQYRIDTTVLSGDSRRMAEAVNEMGESLCKALEAIVKNERLKAELITNVSHDLKTPLTSIVNYVDLLKRENLPGERARQYVEVLEQKSQRLKQLTEDLVEASKISSGNIELEIVRVEMQSMLMQACGEFEERLMERGLTIVWRMEKEPIYIMADGRQLWRILENLLGNIYKYAKEDTEVQVILRKTDGAEVLIALQNEAREKITIEADELTGRFVRGDASRSTEGSGLGLSIAQNLAELLEGRLELKTEDNLFTACLYFTIA